MGVCSIGGGGIKQATENVAAGMKTRTERTRRYLRSWGLCGGDASAFINSPSFLSLFPTCWVPALRS